MARETGQDSEGRASTAARVWALVARQHGVIARRQLLEAGVSSAGIGRRLHSGRLHAVHRGVYVAGRPQLSRCGRWMAAVLRCGPEAVLSHASAAALLGISAEGPTIEVSVALPRNPRPPGIAVCRRPRLPEADVGESRGIPVTSPALTLVDLAARLPPHQLEAAVNAADRLELIDPESLRSSLAGRSGAKGGPALRRILDRRAFVLTDSELERLFARIVRGAGLPMPETQVEICGFRVDFLWRHLALIVETDGLRYHRTAASQSRDRERDQTHAMAGYTTLRFTHAQVRYQPRRVEAALRSVIGRLAVDGGAPGRKPGP